jgi:hypothetical protein
MPGPYTNSLSIAGARHASP